MLQCLLLFVLLLAECTATSLCLCPAGALLHSQDAVGFPVLGNLHLQRQHYSSPAVLTCSPWQCRCCDNSKGPAMVLERAGLPLSLTVPMLVELHQSFLSDPLPNVQANAEKDVAFELVHNQFS